VIADLVRISRPRFWLYLGGTYLVGYTAGAEALADFWSPAFWFALAYFLFPANVFLYGVNDLFDEDTDAFNPKKGDQEHRLRASQVTVVRAAVIASAVLGVALVAALDSWPERVSMLAFLALGAAYSVPPLRLKARPYLDSASNVLYAMPAVFGFAQASGGGLPPAVAVVGAGCWTAAMHLFSAIPDIAADRAAGLETTATRLLERGSLVLCAVLWAVAATSFVYLVPGHAVAWLAFVYPAIPLVLLASPTAVGRAYWLFPMLNAVAGFVLFVAAAAHLVAV
jgi:4-hydroxybenzoate polyprenyltransferase